MLPMNSTPLALAIAVILSSVVATLANSGIQNTQALPKGIKLRILPLGDSITYGIGHASSNSYRAALQSKLTEAGASVEYIGSQRSGNFTNNQNEGWPAGVIDYISMVSDRSLPKKPNVVCVMAGTNDHIYGSKIGIDPKQAHVRLGNLIDKLVGTVPDAAVLVATLIPLDIVPISSAFVTKEGVNGVQEYNAKIPDVVKARADKGKKVAVVSMAAVLQSDLSDGIHPGDGGFAKMADAFYKGIEDAAVKDWIKPPVPV